MEKNLPTNAGDLGLIPRLGRSPGVGNGNPLQYFCLGNPMDTGAWQVTVHGSQRVRHDRVTKTHTHMCVCVCLCVCLCMQGDHIISVCISSRLNVSPLLQLCGTSVFIGSCTGALLLSGLSPAAASRVCSLAAVHGLLVAATSLVGEHRV